MKPLKVLLCHNYYQQAGGEDQVFADEAWLLRSRDQVVQTFSVHNDSIRERSRLGVAWDTIWNRRMGQKIHDMVRAERFDVVHFHNTFPLLSPAVWYAARKAGAAVVQTLHNYRLLCPQAFFVRDGKICTDCLGRTVKWPAVSHSCYRGSRAGTTVLASMLALHHRLGTFGKAVDRYIALTQFGADLYARGGLPAERIQVKFNFIREAPPLGAGAGDYVLFVGRLAVEKGIDVLVDAWQRADMQVPLWIIGDGPLADKVRALAASRSNVRWLGKQKSDVVRQAMQDAMCLLMPSTGYEGQPMVMTESFAVGTPVVASRLGPLEEMIDCGENGVLFTPGSGAELAAIVTDLAQAPERRRQLRAGARATYEDRYTAERNWERLSEIYEQAIVSRQGSAARTFSMQAEH